MYRIEIDESECIGYGLCAQTAPKSLRLNADNLAEPVENTVDDENVLEAALVCPMGQSWCARSTITAPRKRRAKRTRRRLGIKRRACSERERLDPLAVSQFHLIRSIDGLGQATTCRREQWQRAVDSGGGDRIAVAARN